MSDADKYVNIVTGSIPIFVETVRYEWVELDKTHLDSREPREDTRTWYEVHRLPVVLFNQDCKVANDILARTTAQGNVALYHHSTPGCQKRPIQRPMRDSQKSNFHHRKEDRIFSLDVNTTKVNRIRCRGKTANRNQRQLEQYPNMISSNTINHRNRSEQGQIWWYPSAAAASGRVQESTHGIQRRIDDSPISKRPITEGIPGNVEELANSRGRTEAIQIVNMSILYLISCGD